MKIFKKAKVFITLLVSALLITGGAVSVFAATATTQENTPYDGMDFFTIDGAPGYCAERKKGVPINENYTIQATDKDGYAASSNGRDEKDWWRDDANHWDDVKHILYVGYPADKAGLGSGVDASTFRAATQEAVWYFTNSLPLSDNEAGRLAQKIIDDTTSVPSSATLNFWVADNKNANQSIFTLTVDDAPEPLIKNTTARVNDTAGSIELAAGEEGTFTDVIEIENFGEDYTVECTLYKDGAVFATAAVKADQAEVTVTFDQKITEAGEYSVSSLLKKGDEVVGGTHNAALDIASETVTVTVKEKEEEGDTTPDEFTIKISKKELGGAEIPGAEMTLTDAEGNEVEAWTSISVMRPHAV